MSTYMVVKPNYTVTEHCSGCRKPVVLCDCILCLCPNPDTDALGECRSCHRKPLDLLLASAARLASR